MRKKRRDESLCWRCARAAGSRMCCWARTLTPVPGWEAQATHWEERDEDGLHVMTSACVRACPLYEPDRGERRKLQKQAREAAFAALVQGEDRAEEERE